MKLRRHERLIVRIETVARGPAVEADVDVLDLSVSGCRMRSTSSAMRVGATVVLQLSDGDDVSGQIVWTNDREGGVEFHRQIEESVVDRYASTSGERRRVA